MFAKYKKILILCISLITLVGCNSTYHLGTFSIEINPDLGGNVSINFNLSTSEDDETFIQSEIETLIEEKLVGSGRFKNNIDIFFSDTEVFLQYREEFKSLEDLEKILIRISGKDVSLSLEVTETDISETYKILGIPTDDLFFFDWIYDIIEEEQIFGDSSNTLRSESTDFLIILWDGNFISYDEVTYEVAPVLSQFEHHATLYKNNESSYRFVLGFEDASIVEAYERLLTDDMSLLYPNKFKVSSKGNSVTFELLKGNWDNATLSSYLYGIQLIHPSAPLEEYMDLYSILGAKELEKFVGKKEVSDVTVFPISLYKSNFRFTKDAVSERTVTFDGLELVDAITNLSFTKANITHENKRTISIGDNELAIVLLVSDKENSMSQFVNGPTFPLLGGIGIGIASCSLILFLITKRKISKQSDNASDSSSDDSLTLESDQPTISTIDPSSDEDEITDSDYPEIVISDTLYDEDSLNHEIHEVQEPNKPRKQLSDCLKNRISLYAKAFSKPETYLTIILTGLCLFGMVVILAHVSVYALRNALTTQDFYPYIIDDYISTMKPSTEYLAQALSLLISKATVGVSLFEFKYQVTSIIPMILLIFPGLWLSKTLCRIIFKREYHKESAYITMTLLILILTISSLFKISMSNLFIQFDTLSIFTHTLPIVVIILYLMFEKKTVMMKRMLTKFFIVLLLLLLILISIFIFYKIPFISYFAIFNFLVLGLAMYPFGLLEFRLISDSILGSLTQQFNVFLLFALSGFGLLVLGVIILMVIFVFMDIRIMFRCQKRLNRSLYAIAFSAGISIVLMILTQLGTIAFDMSLISFKIVSPWYSVLLTFFFNFLLSFIILVVFKTEQEQERSKFMKRLDKLIDTVQKWVFK